MLPQSAQQSYRGLVSSSSSPHGDSFPISYDVGFITFLALACSICVIHAIVSACVRRKKLFSGSGSSISCHRLGPIAALVAALLLGASAGLVTFGGVCIPRNSGADRADAMGATIFGAVGVVLFGIIVMLVHFDCLPENESYPCSSVLANVGISAATCLLLIPGLTVLAIYCRRMVEVEKFAYHGPMRITGHAVEFFEGERCKRGSICNGFKGRLEVEYGYEWACASPSIWCRSIVFDDDCHANTCEDVGSGTETRCSIHIQTDQEAQSEAKACMETKYELRLWFNTIDLDKREFDRKQPPLDDPNWPWVEMYGDCDSCSAAFSVPLESALGIKPIGVGLSIAGGSMLVIATVATLLLRWTKPLGENEIMLSIPPHQEQRNFPTNSAVVYY
uniref:Uncharacterized protein n=1 Tax=Odontella aurita TaxID=265563 RepID=A0A7S4J319_9STRA|mmetsp:Transcript_37127/g.111220  ORF Transcript_37127/g.111220 Transcript_37127/m.111220 type:complete len:391 (+) Transcript_37127:579-1751(+)